MEKTTKVIFLFVLAVAVSPSKAFAENFNWEAPHAGRHSSASSACEAVMGHYKATFPNYEFRMGNPFYRDTSSYYRRNYGLPVGVWDDSSRSVGCNIERNGAFGWFYGGVGAGEVINLRGDTCPAGTTFGGDGVIGCAPNPTPNPSTNNGPPKCPTGNPIDIATGNKFQEETDWVAPHNPLMKIQRHYNSSEGEWTFGYPKNHIEVEAGTPRCALDPLDLSALGCPNLIQYEATLYSAGGKASNFFSSPRSSLSNTAGYWRSAKGSTFQLFKAAVYSDENITLNDVFQRDLGQVIEVYGRDTNSTGDAAYLLRYIKSRQGHAISLDYDNQRVLVSDKHGSTLVLNLDGAGRVYKAITADNAEFDYVYNNNGQLSQVTYPGQTSRQFIYDEADPSLLVGIIDENGSRYATWAYDEAKRAVLSEHANGVERVSLVFNADGSTSETNALGLVTKYHFQTLDNGLKVPVLVEGFQSPNCIAANSSYTYDQNGYRNLVTDRKGIVTDYDYDARGLEVRRIEAKGTPEQRVIETQWHNVFMLPLKIIEPGRVTDFSYDSDGRLVSKTSTDPSYTYNADNGLVETIDGPRVDVTDVTSFQYHQALSGLDSQNVSVTTNALGHQVQFTSYDAAGRLLQQIDPNGVVTDFTYTVRGWLESATVRGPSGNSADDATTGFSYDAAGNLIQVIFPEGDSVSYEYDAARRLIAQESASGERIEFTLDLLGNRLETRYQDASATETYAESVRYDELGRLLKRISPFGEETLFGYDANGNQILRTDAASQSWQSSYDALNRLVAQIDPKAGEARYQYDALDRLTKVTDQKGLSTDYQYDAFGNKTQQISPDTGTTNYDYDAAGNLIRKTDARGVVSEYQYDALNRLTAVTYPAHPAENVQYQYDLVSESSEGIGRLGRITDLSGVTEYSYDARGNITSKRSLVEAQSYVVAYRYNLANRLVGLTYPDGRVVRYERDEQGRILRVQTQASVAAPWVALADQVSYQPFGGVSEFAYGNGVAQNFAHDQAYRLTGLTTQGLGPVLNRQYEYDALDNVSQINDAVTPANSQSFVYDELSRLLEADGDYGALNYQYDAVGNRLSQSKTSGSQNLVETYSYAAGSHRLLQVAEQSVSSTRTRTLQYDDSGNLVQDQRFDGQQFSLQYNGSNRLSDVDKSSVPLASYLHNALGQRVAKVATDPAQDEHYLYDEQGQLLTVVRRADNSMTHYVYLDEHRIAMIADPDTASPSQPLNLSVISTGPSTAALSWSASTDNVGVTGYRIYRNGALITTQTGLSYADTGLAAATYYSYQVSAVDAAGNVSSLSLMSGITTPPAPDTESPSQPMNLTVISMGPDTAGLSWSASTDNVGVTGYRIYRNGVLITTQTGLSYSNTGLAASTYYSYQVSALDAAGNVSALSLMDDITTPPPPDTESPSQPLNLTVISTSPSTAALSWFASTDNVGVTGYRIYRNGTLITTQAGLSYADTGLTAATYYAYQVSAVDVAGNASTLSLMDDITTPAAPVPVTLFDRTVSNGNDDAEEATDGRVVLTSSDLELAFDTGMGNQHVGLRFTSVQVPANAVITNAYLQFQAREAGSSATQLNIMAINEPNTATFTTTAYSISTRNRVGSVAWSNPPAWVVGQNYQSPDIASLVQSVVNLSGWNTGNAMGFVLTGTGTRNAYAYNSGSTRAPLLHIEYYVGAPVNQAPTVNAGIDQTISLSSPTASLSGSVLDDGRTGYLDVRWSVQSGPGTVIFANQFAASTTATFSAAGVYQLQLRADDSQFVVTDTVTVTVTTPPAPDTLAPSQPQNLTVISSGPNTTALSWSASTDNVGVTGYRIYRNGVLITTQTGLSYADTGLAAATYYAYQVSAVDAAGNASALSLMDDITTPPAPVAVTVFDRTVSNGNDDGEEATDGRVVLTSSDLELAFDTGMGNQHVGIRFTSVQVPANAVITNAYLQFQANEAGSSATSLNMMAINEPNTATFTTTAYSISTRSRVGNVVWSNQPAWVVGQNYQSPDIASLVQSVVNLSGWNTGNAMGFVLTGTGTRTAYSYNSGGATRAARLHIEYYVPSP